MYCWFCGAPLDDNARYCHKCGNQQPVRLDPASPSSSAVRGQASAPPPARRPETARADRAAAWNPYAIFALAGAAAWVLVLLTAEILISLVRSPIEARLIGVAQMMSPRPAMAGALAFGPLLPFVVKTVVMAVNWLPIHLVISAGPEIDVATVIGTIRLVSFAGLVVPLAALYASGRMVSKWMAARYAVDAAGVWRLIASMAAGYAGALLIYDMIGTSVFVSTAGGGAQLTYGANPWLTILFGLLWGMLFAGPAVVRGFGLPGGVPGFLARVSPRLKRRLPYLRAAVVGGILGWVAAALLITPGSIVLAHSILTNRAQDPFLLLEAITGNTAPILIATGMQVKPGIHTGSLFGPPPNWPHMSALLVIYAAVAAAFGMAAAGWIAVRGEGEQNPVERRYIKSAIAGAAFAVVNVIIMAGSQLSAQIFVFGASPVAGRQFLDPHFGKLLGLGLLEGMSFAVLGGFLAGFPRWRFTRYLAFLEPSLHGTADGGTVVTAAEVDTPRPARSRFRALAVPALAAGVAAWMLASAAYTGIETPRAAALAYFQALARHDYAEAASLSVPAGGVLSPYDTAAYFEAMMKANPPAINAGAVKRVSVFGVEGQNPDRTGTAFYTISYDDPSRHSLALNLAAVKGPLGLPVWRVVQGLANIQISSHANGARVFLDGLYTGVSTGSDGTANLNNVLVGPHQVTIELGTLRSAPAEVDMGMASLTGQLHAGTVNVSVDITPPQDVQSAVTGALTQFCQDYASAFNAGGDAAVTQADVVPNSAGAQAVAQALQQQNSQNGNVVNVTLVQPVTTSEMAVVSPDEVYCRVNAPYSETVQDTGWFFTWTNQQNVIFEFVAQLKQVGGAWEIEDFRVRSTF